jgi:acyl carrier protein
LQSAVAEICLWQESERANSAANSRYIMARFFNGCKVARQDAITKKILKHVRQATGIVVTDLDQPLNGIDSLTVLELVMDLEREFNITIPDEKLERLATVADIVELVKTLLAMTVS